MARPRDLTMLSLLSMALALVVALPGCAGANAPQRPGPAGTSSPTQVTSAPQESPTAQGSVACKPEAGSTFVGDLAMSRPSVSYGFNADYALPAGLPERPLTVTNQSSGEYVQGALLRSRPVAQQGAFVVNICDTSATRAYSLTSFAVRLTSIAPYVDSLNVLNACAFLYSRPNGIGGECVSGFQPDAEPVFTFPASASPPFAITQTLASPMRMAPGQSLAVSFDTQLSASPVIVDYQLGLGIDGAAVTYPAALRTQPVVIAPVARRWAGDYCRTAQMQALIPTSIPPDTSYACPKV